jgi:hypothetical protein
MIVVHRLGNRMITNGLGGWHAVLLREVLRLRSRISTTLDLVSRIEL